MRALLLVGLLGCASALGAAKSKPKTPSPAVVTHTVVMENMQFTPATLEVAVGDSVEWVNKDLVPHTASDEKNVFDTGVVLADAKAKVVMKTAGEIAYGCKFHPTMKGNLSVQGPAGTKP